ncbi:type IV toxin-antitoxin system AbiEi family antitoxin domain-containing protein [Arthrobacter sp. HY1533]|uniref:type IV toxin-antitoxin system AbiEi family antitoxin domain-containing protein n=1 Tax=Arthrobacter sp. HY1533 TaxID=2970919 RepID=UPI0022B9E0E2|nr:type IV toxin-antitoxin system AbiEi family antitoxin domain-containing protein [Arthrobacter sp. HY1533]
MKPHFTPPAFDAGTTPGGHAADTSPARARLKAAFSTRKVAYRTAELREAGFGSRSIRRLVEDGTLMRLRPGCYVLASWWAGLSIDAQRLYRVRLHSFATRTTSARGYVYSHTSAAIMHGLHLWNVDDLVHVTQPGKPSKDGCGKDTAVHVCTLAPGDIVEVNRTKVTSLERTVVDCALTLPYKQALIIADHALRLGASLPKMLAVADSLGRHRGIRTLRKVLRFADALSESPGETLTRDLMRELLIEMPELQHWIDTRLGQFRADFAWVRQKVVLEFDGKRKYFQYRPTDEAVYRERKREAALIEAGWTVLRIEWKDLFNEAAFKHRILAALAH